MAGTLLRSLSLAETVSLALLGALVVLVALMGIQAWKKSRLSAAELERRRRLLLKRTGNMGDGSVVEMRDHLIFYSYDVRGIEYTASQDVSGLVELLPTDPTVLFGPVAVKYDPRNPANSIVLCEEWSGLRRGTKDSLS